ncbi:hypothetical protein BC939DRAFT_44835 [Gamsiella multidivaricata]|uniref:uncharacterized protein n=1 Tax=Gamsiella multidivaricata TaxID=101098 RepID=UPI00221FE3D5|nr:uncharacterized protein BC939DRAFT_44835 [Gamsiella multidivaricata]KAG0367310.1 hypothetical protein BGZ54_004067 [Gamsiella multidivaricata]KAI7816436.1 hypothetical protein BC939DRAFT_44835 [Gamsiella multidivaricata]
MFSSSSRRFNNTAAVPGDSLPNQHAVPADPQADMAADEMVMPPDAVVIDVHDFSAGEQPSNVLAPPNEDVLTNNGEDTMVCTMYCPKYWIGAVVSVGTPLCFYLLYKAIANRN